MGPDDARAHRLRAIEIAENLQAGLERLRIVRGAKAHTSVSTNANELIVLPTRAYPQVAVDASGRYYVTDYYNNSISAYQGGSRKLLKKITQKKGIVAITYTTIGP